MNDNQPGYEDQERLEKSMELRCGETRNESIDLYQVKSELRANLDELESLINDEYINIIDLSRCVEDTFTASNNEDFARIGKALKIIVDRGLRRYAENFNER